MNLLTSFVSTTKIMSYFSFVFGDKEIQMYFGAVLEIIYFRTYIYNQAYYSTKICQIVCTFSALTFLLEFQV